MRALIQAVRWEDVDLSMPPENKLRPEDIATLERWVAMGVAWPDVAEEPAEEAAAEAPAEE